MNCLKRCIVGLQKTKIAHNSQYIFIIVLSSILSSCLNPCEQRIIDKHDIFNSIHNGDIDRAQVLYEQGAPLYDKCAGSLYHALNNVENIDAIKFVEKLPIDIEYEDSHGNTAIYVTSGKVLRRLLQKGANVHHVNRKGETALFYQAACAIWSKNEIELRKRLGNIRTLVKHGSNVNAKVDGKTILDVIANESIPPKIILLGHDISLVLHNRSKIYDFMHNLGAKTNEGL